MVKESCEGERRPVGAEAAERALYGPDGFYLRSRPAAHFRTSVHASPLFAGAVARLLAATGRALGTGETAFVDMAAGRGELATAVAAATAVTPEASGTHGRCRAYAVERAPAPADLDPRVTWLAAPPPGANGAAVRQRMAGQRPRGDRGDRRGRRAPLRTGPPGRHGGAGGPGVGRGRGWLARWWPIAGAGPGTRAEIGRPRDEAWREAVGSLARGLAVAVDYGHTHASRPPSRTLTGFRDGREVRPVRDGSCDLTSHVAMDAARSGRRAGLAAGGPARPGRHRRTPAAHPRDRRSRRVRTGAVGRRRGSRRPRPAASATSPG